MELHCIMYPTPHEYIRASSCIFEVSPAMKTCISHSSSIRNPRPGQLIKPTRYSSALRKTSAETVGSWTFSTVKMCRSRCKKYTPPSRCVYLDHGLLLLRPGDVLDEEEMRSLLLLEDEDRHLPYRYIGDRDRSIGGMNIGNRYRRRCDTRNRSDYTGRFSTGRCTRHLRRKLSH